MDIAKNSIPAAALISLSFNTGMVYPSTCSPNCIALLIFLLDTGYLITNFLRVAIDIFV
jgi:hypothetical protein